jgi:transposase
VLPLSELWLLSEAQMRRIEPHFPLSHGIPRVDDRRIVSGLIFVNRNGLCWRDVPAGYGPHKTIYNRFIRWSRQGVFYRIFAELAAKAGMPDQLIIDATHLKALRTAASLQKRGSTQTYRAHQRRTESFADFELESGQEKQGARRGHHQGREPSKNRRGGGKG